MCVCLLGVYAGDAYRYTIQPIYDNLTESVTCHIRRRRPSSPVLFDLFYYVEVTSRGFRSPVVRREVRADAVNGTDAGRRGSLVADYLSVEFDVGVDLADDFLLRASGLAGVQTPGGDRTVTGTVWNAAVVHGDVTDHHGGGSAPTRFRVHEIAQSSAFVTSVRPRTPFGISTSRWRRPAAGATDASAASCDMSTSRLLPAVDDINDDFHPDSERQTVKVVIQDRTAHNRPFRYYIMLADSPPFFHFKIPGSIKHISVSLMHYNVLLSASTRISYIQYNYNRVQYTLNNLKYLLNNITAQIFYFLN